MHCQLLLIAFAQSIFLAIPEWGMSLPRVRKCQLYSCLFKVCLKKYFVKVTRMTRDLMLNNFTESHQLHAALVCGIAECADCTYIWSIKFRGCCWFLVENVVFELWRTISYLEVQIMNYKLNVSCSILLYRAWYRFSLSTQYCNSYIILNLVVFSLAK